MDMGERGGIGRAYWHREVGSKRKTTNGENVYREWDVEEEEEEEEEGDRTEKKRSESFGPA